MSRETRILLRSSAEEKKQFEESAALENLLLSEFLRRAAHPKLRLELADLTMMLKSIPQVIRRTFV